MDEAEKSHQINFCILAIILYALHVHMFTYTHKPKTTTTNAMKKKSPTKRNIRTYQRINDELCLC